MKQLSLYFETSVWNFILAEDAPEKQEVTQKLFAKLPSPGIELYISELVLTEISVASDLTKRQLISHIKNVDPIMLEQSQEIQNLAHSYIQHGVLTPKSIVDAFHIATSTVYQMDAIVSWNMKHIANIRRQEKVAAINMLNGYTQPIQLITPMEVFYGIDETI